MDIYYEEKKSFFNSGKTLEYKFRIEKLNQLKNNIKKYEKEIISALEKDLRKPEYESYTSEIGIVYQEINHTIKNLKKWMKPKKVATPLFIKPGKSYIYPQAKGIVLIISPWNYPFQLAISPLVGAIAAGCCALIKPSNKSIHTQTIIEKIISSTFDKEYISVITGPGKDVVEPIITKYKFDHIFFTGSQNVGKSIMKLASNSLTPVTLELGGKSPVIVCKDANIDLAAKRIAWAKFYNAGQTCVSPDYLLIDKNVKDEFISSISKWIKYFYGENLNQNLSRIIDENSFNRIKALMEDGNILIGGYLDSKDKFISPTILDEINLDSNIMKEEIFGPLLPLITFNDISEVLNIIDKNPYPLALYLFTKDKNIEDFIINRVRFGGGCINEAVTHLINSNLPFGGIGYSGMGNYHSKYSFDTFTHEKSIMKKKDLEFDFKYPPYTRSKLNLAKKFLK